MTGQATLPVLVVDDDPDLRAAIVHSLNCADIQTLCASTGPEALELLSNDSVSLVLSDIQMEPMDGLSLLKVLRRRHPGISVVLMTAYASVQRAVDAVRAGAIDYLVKPMAADQLVSIVNKYRLCLSNLSDEYICEAPSSRALLALALKVSKTDASILINGESGTGKEVLAQFIHTHSRRKHKPFVAVNCAAIPENMLEAILFGHEKGAFTGAHKSNAGKFEQANTGTLLLDEVSEMDLHLQAKLLRVIQEKEVERIGANGPISLDVRILATTNRDLKSAVRDGHFREDLYYRLNVFPLPIDPLRLRIADILPLARFFLATLADGKSGKHFEVCAQKKLLAYQWPGNVRELQNVVQRALILSEADLVLAGDICLDDNLQPGLGQVTTITPEHFNAALGSQLAQTEYQLILDALESHKGNRADTAGELGISSRTLRYKLAKMRDLGVNIPS